MRKIAFALLPLAAVLLAAGCVEENQEKKAEKTAHYFNSVLKVGKFDFEWTENDRISVFDGTQKGQALMNSNKRSSTTAKFSGYAYASDTYYALYNALEASKWEVGDVPAGIFTIPDLQVMPETGLTYAREAVVAMSAAEGDALLLEFKPATSFLSFSVGKDGPYVASVVLKSLSGKALAGEARAVVGKDGSIETAAAAGGKSEVTLRSYDGECPLNEGTFLLSFAPGSYPEGDLEVTANYTNGKAFKDTLEKVSTVKAGSVIDFGAIPEYVSPAGPTDPDEPLNPGQIMDKYDIFLLIGQSNMAGRGTLTAADKKETVEGVYLLDSYMAGFAGDYTDYTGSKDYDEKPVPATHPFNQYSTIRKSLSTQQMNPGYGFATTLRDYNKAHGNTRPILIVCNPRGGTAISEWAKGKEYYSEAVRRTRIAMKYGTLKGILWHQGCGDSSNSGAYMSKLVPLVTNLRADLGVGNIPFVAGELAYWRGTSPQFNEMIRTIAANIPNSDWVSAQDCGPLKPESLNTSSPDPHFSRDGQILLGTRYGEKIIEMLYTEKEPSTLKLISDAIISDVSNAGGTFEASLESNTTWSVSVKSGSTASVTLLSSSGYKNGTFSFKVGANMDQSAKSATIVVSCEGCTPVEITVTQKPASEFMAVFPEAKFVDASVFSSLPCPSRYFKIVSTKAWTAKVGSGTTAGGVSITTTSGNGNLDKFEVKVAEPNSDWNNRKTVEIEFTLSDGSVEKVTMYQEKRSVLALEFRDQDSKTMFWPFKEDLTTSTESVTGGVKGSLSCEGYVFPYYGKTCVCKESNYGWRIGTGDGSYFESPAIEGKALKKVVIGEQNGGRTFKVTDLSGAAVTTNPAAPATVKQANAEFTVDGSAGKAYRITLSGSGTLRILYLRFEYE